MSNPLFDIAKAFVAHTGRNLFLTGKAGTGKTTFLREIRNSLPKEMVVVAPTGVAAINAGGVTIHSFFQIPFGPFVPKGSWASAQNEGVHNASTFLSKVRIADSKRQIIRNMDLLIIDEVSMVRADMLDAIDTLLRYIRRKNHLPFGGVQVLFIGDLLQLPPVVQDHEWEILRQYYDSPFFFDARVLADHPPVCIELQKVYRQSDTTFIQLLNRVRDNKLSHQDLEFLNSHFKPHFKAPNDPSHQYITLSTHNYKASQINESELNKLPGDAYRFKAKVEGDFSEKSYPADEVLVLKEGAQVMFIKNDKGEYRRYFNGKLGVVSHLDKEGGIRVKFPEEDEEIELELEEWDNIRYSFDEETQSIEEEKLGRFLQYPLRLAWAITIHKSQGLTFERAIVDAGAAFSPGQVYVALSRLTGLEGLVLHSRIPQEAVMSDERVIQFMRIQPSQDELLHILKKEQKVYLEAMLMDAFEWGEHIRLLQTLLRSLEKRKLPKPSEAQNCLKEVLQGTIELETVAKKFTPKIKHLLTQAPQSLPFLQERVEAAVKYFSKEIQEKLEGPLQLHLHQVFTWKRVKQYTNDLKALQQQLHDKTARMHRAAVLAAGMAAGKDIAEILNEAGKARKNAVLEILKDTPPPPPDVPKPRREVGETYQITLDMWKSGKSMEDIATERHLAISTIESHLARLVLTGSLRLGEILQEEKINIIQQAIAATEPPLLNEVMRKLGDGFTYGEVRMVMAESSQNKD
jgi:hypothetical protein